MSATSPFGWWNQLRLQWRLGLAFLVMAPLIDPATSPLVAVLNWQTALARKP